MDDRISNDYLSDAIDELVNVLGVKEEPATDNLISLLNKKDAKKCIKEIAKDLGLDIEINLSYVPKDYKAENTSKFESNDLVKTDWRGRGVEGITAQVFIPGNLPIYGSSTLKGFPIDVRVSENCHEQPQTFISVMSHELSHILLHSLNHTQKNNEIYTDLTPLILGFSNIIEQGRKSIKTTSSGNIITTYTTSYGYLNDRQFFFARDKIKMLLEKYRHDKVEIFDRNSNIRQLVSRMKKDLYRFKMLLGYLDEHRKRKIKEQDGRRIVQFHSFDYLADAERSIDNDERLMMEAENYCTSLKHYIKNTPATMHGYIKNLDFTISNLKQINHLLKDDLSVLLRNVGLGYRIKLMIDSMLFLEK
jgi:hypothetical protein